MSRHTPGPWTQYAKGSEVYGGDGFFITAVQSKRPETDARLIAAAPDLLEALKAMDNAMCDGFETQSARMAGRKALIAARAAIAKAEGK